MEEKKEKFGCLHFRDHFYKGKVILIHFDTKTPNQSYVFCILASLSQRRYNLPEGYRWPHGPVVMSRVDRGGGHHVGGHRGGVQQGSGGRPQCRGCRGWRQNWNR